LCAQHGFGVEIAANASRLNAQLGGTNVAADRKLTQ